MPNLLDSILNPVASGSSGIFGTNALSPAPQGPLNPDPPMPTFSLENIFELLRNDLRQRKGAGLFPFFEEFGQRAVGDALRRQAGAMNPQAIQRIANIFLMSDNPNAIDARRNFLNALFSSSPTFTPVFTENEGPIDPNQLPGIEYTPPTLPPPPSGAGDPGGTTTTPPTGGADPGGIGGINVGDPRPPGSVTTFPSMPTAQDRLGIMESLGIPAGIRTMPLEQRRQLRNEAVGPPVPAGRLGTGQTIMDRLVALNEDPVPRPPRARR